MLEMRGGAPAELWLKPGMGPAISSRDVLNSKNMGSMSCVSDLLDAENRMIPARSQSGGQQSGAFSLFRALL